MFCLKWCFEGFLIICDRVAAEIFQNICILQSSQRGGDTLYQTFDIGGYFTLALFTKGLDLRPQIH